jgi:hypothetical protein
MAPRCEPPRVEPRDRTHTFTAARACMKVRPICAGPSKILVAAPPPLDPVDAPPAQQGSSHE